MSRLKYVLLMAAGGLACRPALDPPPPPPSPPPGNHPPVAVVGGPYTSATGVVNFDGSASSDPDGDGLTYNWNFGDGGSSTAVSPSHAYTQDGEFAVSLRVTDSKGAQSNPSTTTATISRPSPNSVVFMGAGNIATCSGGNDARTADLIDAVPNAVVFTLGDNAFPDGSASNYADCYEPTWGRFKSRTRPTLGNHEYNLGNADGSFDYFGDAAGPQGKGYYSYEIGTWHVIVLNDNNDYVAIAPGSEQATWLADDLAANTKPCTIAMWHVPRFQSSNTKGFTSNGERKPLWDLLYEAGAEIVINAQPHHYERLKPMTPSGGVDESRGIREFIVGTGGESAHLPTAEIHPNSEVRGGAFGVLKLTLKDNSYDWAFVPVPGSSFSDSGSGSCH